MSINRTSSTITIDSTRSTVAALPDLVGFTPEHSLVVIYLAGNSVIVTARSDVHTRWHLTAGEIASTGKGVGADGAILIVCSTRGDSLQLPWLGEIAETGRSCELAGIQVRESLLVDGDQFWTYDGAHSGRVSVEGHSIERECPSPITAVAIPKHQLPATSRAAFISRYQRRPDLEPSRAAFEAAVGEVVSIAVRAEQAWTDVCELAFSLEADSGSELLLARLQLAMQDVRIRDLILCRVSEAELGQHGLVDAIVRAALSAPEQLRPRVAGAAAALLAAIEGNSVAAECLIEVAQGDSLAVLTATSVRAALPPSMLREVFASAKPEVLSQLSAAGEDSAG